MPSISIPDPNPAVLTKATNHGFRASFTWAINRTALSRLIKATTLATASCLAANAFALPTTVEAESYNYMSGVQTETTSDTGGGLNVGWIDAGDWMAYSNTVVNIPSSAILGRSKE